ncbi:hypothetical protein IL306_012214 [Fusarium sp. DS 682]|nr:hypothetical protein IL306_012214 [Fusarium sp. DS 682]
MKLSIFISAFATSASLVSAESRHQARVPHGSPNHLNARDATCPRPMCQKPAGQKPNDPPSCATCYDGCEFDKFPCTDYMTPKWTDTDHCYCILATDQAMDAYCQERGFKSGCNPWKYYYAVECHGPANDQVCEKDCQAQGRGHGRVNKYDPNGACACDKANPPYDTCLEN